MSLTERIYGKETAGKPAVSSDTQKNLYTAAANKKPSLANRIAQNGGQPTLYADAAAKQKPSLASRIEANGGTPYADAAAQAKQSGTQSLYAQAAKNISRGENISSGSPLAPMRNLIDDRESTVGSGKYADILKASDYAALSKAGESKAGKLFGDARYDYINDIGDMRIQHDVSEARGQGAEYSKYALMTQDEVGVYNYLYATQGKRAANAYLSDLEPELDKQWYSGLTRGNTEVLGKNAGTRALASTMTVLAQPARTLSSMIAMADDAVRTAKGQEINPYSQFRRMSNLTQDLRADTSQHIEETNPGMGGKVGSFVYNTAMSAADSAMNALVAKGIGEAVGLTGDTLMKATNILGSALMSSEVASLSIAESKEKGYSNAGALALGLTRGAIEYASEAVGGEWVIRKIKANPLSFVKSMALTMIPEGMEEVMSDAANGVVNLAIDAAFGTEESGIPKMLEYYRTSGTDWQKKHAELATVLAVLGQEGLSFLGGALATLGSSGVQYGTNRANINQTAERLDTTPKNVVQMMQDAQTENPGVIYALAELTDAENADDLRQKIGTKEDMKRAAEYLTQQMEAGGRFDAQEGTYTAGAQNAPAGAQRAQNEGNSTTPAAAINIQEGMNNGQSTYHREESGAAYVGSRGQTAEGAEGGLQALTGGRTEVQRGVGTDTQADLRQVTPAQLGIRNGGTEAVTVVDAQRLGGEAKSAYDAVLENGLEPVAVRGAIQVGDGYANAYTESGRVFFRVDAVDSRGNVISPEMLVQHEMFHNYASEEVIRATDEVIRESMTAEEYDAMRDAYKADYAGVYDFANMSVDEIERLLTEEIAADAYAGLNWFSGDAPVQEAVRAETERNAPARRAEAQQETTGPPGRATAAGIGARTADSAALRRAEALEKSGTDNETIRQETGWYRGMDGQWRFEIDDSGAAFSRSGEAQYSADNADYARYTQLMNRMLTGELTEAEHAELLGLDKKNGSTKKELARRIDEGNATLRDIMQHNALFEAYPEIAETKVKFADMPSGTAGSYNRETNTITLDTKLKYDANDALDALMHEVQHRVQAAEGFASGTNPGYWNRGENYDRAAEKYRDNRARLLNGLSTEDLALYNEYRSAEREMGAMLDGSVLYDESRMDALEKRSDELYRELYGKEWFGKLNRYDRILGDAGEAVKEFYRNTVGEIEARDTTSRRRMSAVERKNTPPNLGDADTVFADFDSVKYMSAEDAAYDAETAGIKEQLIQSQEKLNKMEVVSKKTVPENLRSKPQAAEWAINELKGKPDYVDRKGVGQVDVSQKAIRNAVKYADTPAEKAALVAAPDVIKRGIEIGGHDNHKSRGKSTMTIAAPVELNGQRGNMAVVINLRGNKYYAHRILTPDGAVFKFEHGKELKIDTGRESQRGVTVSGSLANATSSVSNNTIRSTAGNSQEKSSGKASVEVSGINSRTAAELRREYERRMQEYQKATQRDDPNFPYIDEMKWMQAAERRLAELGDGKHRRRTVGSTKRDIMQLFSTDRANRTDVERVLNRNIGEMMAQGEIRGDALDTLVNELLQTGSVVSSSKNSPWIDETYESIRSDLKGSKLYVSKDMWRDFSKDEARELRERARAAGITLSDNRRYTPPDVRNIELAEKYGEALFPTDISAPDMLRNIIYCAEQGANEKQTLADRLWDEAQQEGLGEAREHAYERMVNDLRNKTEVILREFAEDNHLKLKEQTKTEAKPVSYFDLKKAPVKEFDRKKGDYNIIGEIGSYTKEIAELENALETENRYVISEGEARYEARIEEENGVLYASVWKNGERIAGASSRKRKNLPNWAAMEIRKDVGARIMFHPGLENRGESYNADLKAAEEAGYPVFEKKNGEKVQTVPFWTWLKSKEYGNYGLVIDKTNAQDADGNPIVFAYYFNKKKGTGKVVMESRETAYVVDGKYSDPDAAEKRAARMKDEESEAMRAEEREALWGETQKGSPFEAQPNATTDTREQVTKATSAGVQRLFQQLISKGKTEVSTQGESGIRTYTAKMNTNGVEYWVDISDGRQDVQRFREFEKEKAAQLAAEWMDKEANRAYTAANEKRAEARRAELSAEENAKIAELFGNTEELKTAETPEDAPSPGETAESRVTDEIVKAEKSFRESLADVTHGAMRMFVNAGETVRRISKQTKNKSLEGYYFNAGAYSQRAGNWIAKGGARTDISGHKTGESLMDILGDIMKTPEKYKDFQLMLLHRNNVDRMRYDSTEEVQNLTKCVTTIEDLYPKLRGLDNDYLYQTAVPGDKRDMLSREWKETVLDELLNGEMPEIADISEAAQMLIFTRQKISEAKKNGLKPVFGYEVTAYDSQLEAERLLKANPEFDALAKRVYAYFDDLLQYRIDAGLDTQKHVDAMKKRYPNYVPTMRVEGTEGKTARRARRNGGIVVSNAIGRAVGGDAVIMPLHTAMSRKTVAVMKNAGLNQFGEQLVQSWNQDKSIPGVNKVDLVDYSSTDQYVDSEELYVPVTNNVFSVLRGNDRYNITMDEGLAQALNAFQPDKYANSDIAKLLKKGNDLFKALCTGYNPIFMVRNLVRDAQDAAFYSTDSATWAKMFPSAWKQIVTNGEIWQQYKALGGSYASMLDYTTGMVKEPKSAAGKLAAKYESLGQAIEAAPRLAEFMTILANKGGSKTADGVKTGKFTQSDLMEAMLGAADITTNFARGGTVTKMLNKYLVPFLNPSVQGADKFVRNITDRKGFKAWASLAIKAAALGILPELLNGLLYRDDDEWDDIPDQTKSNYYLFKLGDGYWMKIPRGRALAVFSAGATYAQEKAKGNEPKFSDVIEVVKSNVAPTDIFNQNIATAWTQTKLFNPDNPGTTWYGGNIESDRLQNYRPGERYDEKTDELSKWIGKTFNLSPKKINYLLDQYSGVVGDLLLPWFTPSATASSPALAPLKQAFMLDSTSTNKTTGEYYDLLDELKYDANDGDIGAGITRKYVSHAGDEVNDYYQQIRAIQSDENLTKAEKNRLVRALKAQLIERQKEIIAQAEPYREAVSDYLKAHPELSTDNDAAIAEYAELYGITEDQAESRMDAIVYREANREVFGAEYALRTYNADVYDKARAAYAKGVSFETYYDYYFATKEMHADKDENGKSISGSKKAKVVEYINSLDIPPEQKDALYVAAGYTAKSARNQKWNGGSGGSGGRRGRGKRTALKAPTPKAPEIIIPKSGTASSAKAGGTSKTPKVSGNVIADFTKTASGTDIQKAVTQAKRKALKAGNRTVYVEEGSPIDYFLKYGKLPSLK
ncbi:LPD38 domain-containing protein [Agathobaculum sp.]|uniref:LPD38 domain-containing protein n=1 Tax=Agathobaculum sp. TaxID=2048138 RepID=UPI003AF0FF4F